ncbi:MAG TPA: hypothetical protein VFP97_04635, partial [Chitinophagaceae bacterium]|nr:hypothetical protein [Chitinophagaceae bacterium]
MKCSFKAIILGLLLPAASGAQLTDTIIQGVKIIFSYSPENFPGDWRNDRIDAQGQQIATEEIQRSKQITAKALNKYSITLLEYNLKTVYFLKSMQFFGVGYGGTNSPDALYMTNNGIALGYTNRYLEQTFHHEFSSILF